MADQWDHVVGEYAGLNPRSCAASSMADDVESAPSSSDRSQSAFVRGFIDGPLRNANCLRRLGSQSAFVRGFIDGRSAEGDAAR